MRYLIIGQRYQPLLEKELKKRNVEILWLPDNPDVAPSLAGHADLSAFYNIFNQTLYLAPYLKSTGFPVRLDACSIKYEFLSIKQGINYPNDVQFNIFQNNSLLIFNPETASKAIVQNLSNEAIKISVKQGYSKCCTLAAGERSIITPDNGIYRECIRKKIDALLISQGFIDLPGFDYGFIGGAAIEFENEIAFTGFLDRHTDKNLILKLLAQNQRKVSYLTDQPVFDIGGAVAIL